MAKDYVLQERLGFRISRLSKMMQTRLELHLKAHDLTRLEWCVLSGVGIEGRSSPSDLAEHVGVTRPAVSRLLKGLVARGLLKRTLTDADGRSRKISITEKGRAQLVACLPMVVQNEEHYTSKLSAAQMDALNEALDVMLEGESLALDDL